MTKNGAMVPGFLNERPFTDVHYGGAGRVFGDEEAGKLVAIVVGVNERVGIM